MRYLVVQVPSGMLEESFLDSAVPRLVYLIVDTTPESGYSPAIARCDNAGTASTIAGALNA
jgi:hypothetical protein